MKLFVALTILALFCSADAGVIYKGYFGTYLSVNSNGVVSNTIYPTEFTLTRIYTHDDKYYMSFTNGGSSNSYLSIINNNLVASSSNYPFILTYPASSTTIQDSYSSKYASARPDNSLTLVTASGAWEQWNQITCTGSYSSDVNNCGKCGYQCKNTATCVNSVCVCGAGYSGILCENGPLGKYFIKSAQYNRFMVVGAGSPTTVIGVTNGDSWNFEIRNDGRYSLKYNGNLWYLGVVAQSPWNVYTYTNNDSWEAFDIYPAGGNVYIRNKQTGRYLGMNSNFIVYSTTNSPGISETWTLIKV
jgi:hypothetical protein